MPGFDGDVISKYARGMSVLEIQAYLLELYGTEVSPDLISTIADEVLEEVTQWQPQSLPQSRRHHRTATPGLAQYREGLQDGTAYMEACCQSVRHHVWQAIHHVIIWLRNPDRAYSFQQVRCSMSFTAH